MSINWRMIAMVVVLANLSLWVGHYTGYRDADKSWQLEWAKRNKADSDALAKRQVGERAEEQRRQQAANQAAKDADEDNEQLKADALDAQHSADRLREQLAQLRQQFADSETGKLSSAASSSASKSQAIILLTELLSESNEAAGEYAKEADRAYGAGQACERIYDKVSEQ
ncbi:DUF2514 domain-containing protein [Obesumbacterium proteus]|uniref:DUF2514 domain-containing protein n=1 Tax=Obesumbacterium proteus TaxID=82983 RepID=UPI00242B378F|nr:DUF2514 domain-containing protein [Obesumbacterium proteus]